MNSITQNLSKIFSATMDQSNESFVRVEKQLPEIGRPVIVICRKFRCYGHLDKEGLWRSHYSGEELRDVVGWAECE